ncbi:MAG TPA: TonB-dependent receptor, partial [Parapedobacter sp.]|nr:TonB-dependent receptor [Parapedobacter sp.]
YRSAWTDTVLRGQTLDWKYYPLSDWKHKTRKLTSNDILINTGINYTIIPSLSLDVKYQYEKQLQETVSLEGVDSWMARYTINMWSQLKPDGTIQYGYPYGGKYQFTNADLSSHQFRGQVNLNQHVGDDHEIVAIAGGEIRMLNNKSNGGGLYGFDEELLTFNSNFDHTERYPSLLGGSSQFSNLSSAPRHTTTHFVSMFGNAAYSYRKRYTVSLSARTDASNLFGLKTNDQWNPLYSLGVSWNIANEDFYRLSFLPNLRLRTTYGISGNINPAMTAVTTMQYNSGSTTFGTPYGMLQNYYNPELRWETAKQFNIGVDFGARNQRLQGSFEYFYKRGTDLFGNALLDYTAGVGKSITKNVSSMKGNGLDVELNARIIEVPFKWQSRLNYSTYRDEIVDYLLSRTTGSSYIAYGGGIRQGKPARKGNPVNSVFSYRWGGLDPETGDPIGYLNGEKSTDHAAIRTTTTVDELVYHGSSIPTHFGNWTNSFGYKAFELHVGVSFKLGYYFRREPISFEQLARQGIGTGDFDLRWQKPGDEQWTDVPSIRYPLDSSRDYLYEFSEALVEKGDHVRLQYIRLNYTFQKDQFRLLPFRMAQVYVNANNLGVLWKATKKGVDPDLMMGTTHSVPGSYSVSVGLNINF